MTNFISRSLILASLMGLLLLYLSGTSEAQNNQDCCLSYSTIRLPRGVIKGYTEQLSSEVCDINAIMMKINSVPLIFNAFFPIPAQSNQDCCLSYMRTELPRRAINGYTEQLSNEICDIGAIIFHTKNGLKACANPEDNWVKKRLLWLSTDVGTLVEEIRKAEPLITASRKEQVIHLILRLQEKLGQQEDHKFYLFKVLRAHILPLTNVAFNKSGSCFITGSYDRTCKIWDTASGEELRTLEGHRNVVYAIAFNNPYGDKIATGSFDKTCKLWSAETGKCYHTFRGHTAEIVSSCLTILNLCIQLYFHMQYKIFQNFGHSAEIIALSFNTTGDRIITGSFDHTVAVWDVGTGRKLHTLIGHRAEISSAQFNWDCSLIVTGSMDKTCMLWNAVTGIRVATLTGHDDEVLDVCFDYTGQRIATSSADGSARVYNAETKKCIAKLEGHEGEISKICFNPQGSRILTASSDKTARLWDPHTGQCIQILEGHTDEIFSCAFNYKGDIIITVFSLAEVEQFPGL
ncbi:WD repeat-containing protein 69 [Chelonia mydas]|uniref:C-C motif chemokine n=1 Tax=Chelonia mydas TaxID=8469 RepID=M7BR19_CHEMY|nr:WD repeat-containing protein 69 [Chelonia mydas]